MDKQSRYSTASSLLGALLKILWIMALGLLHGYCEVANCVNLTSRDLINGPSKTNSRANKTNNRSQLVSWCSEPSQQQRITSGLNTNFTLSPSYSFQKPSYHKSSFLSLFIFLGHSTQEPTSGRVTYFILWSYTGTMCQPQPTQEKLEEVWKSAGE